MATRTRGIGVRKNLADLRAESLNHDLRRSLGPIQLVLLGIGCIVGAGVFVMTGTAAAAFAGPAVTLSFVIAGVACAFTGLCYAELAAMLPASGSSYSYTYATLGEVYAWALGWLLMLEYGLAGSALAAGLAGYLSSLLADLGIVVPATARTPLIGSAMGPGGITFFVSGGVNLLAAVMPPLVAVVLVRGVSQSATVNAAMVALKLMVLLIFVGVGIGHVDPTNWHPFVPANEGGFSYGIAGVVRGASVLFFAYLGFETVSTAALEARNPQRDMPIGILGSLAICTILYMAVALVLTGIVPFRRLGVPEPIALAVDAIGWPALTVLVKLGAIFGLLSVLLVNTYGHSRVCFAMARDGLLPGTFSALHARWKTPLRGTATVAAVAAVAAATLPIAILGDLVSLGTASAFSIVAVSVMWLRSAHPELDRPFRVPLGGVRVRGRWIGTVPVLALLFCLAMVGPVIVDIALKAVRGEWVPLGILAAYVAAGVALYRLYGWRHSRLGHAAPVPAATG